MAANFCSNCGKGVTQEDKFCPECGDSLILETLASEIPSDLDIGQPPPYLRGDKAGIVSRRTVFAISLWTIVTFVITGIADALGMEAGSPLAKVIAGTALVSFAITVLAWIVWIIGEYRKPTPEPKTPQEIALHQEAEKNRERIILAIAIIAAIILGIAALVTFVDIDLLLTFTPTTTP